MSASNETYTPHTKPPFLSRLRISGYKSIAECDVTFAPLTVIVGRNGAGKSNFLDAIGFLRDVVQTNVSDAIMKRGGWRAVACRYAPTHNIRFQATIHLSPNVFGPGLVSPADAEWELLLEQGENQSGRVVSEVLNIHAANAPFNTRVTSIEGVATFTYSPDDGTNLSSTSKIVLIRPDVVILGVVGGGVMTALSAALQAMRVYHPVPRRMRELCQFQWTHPMDEDAHFLAGILNQLEAANNVGIRRVRDYLRLINPDIIGFNSVRHGEYETIRFHVSSDDTAPAHFDAVAMSDGTLRALAILTAAFQAHLPNGPALVGIEEPETSLHPAAMPALIEALDEATSHTQIVVTTHSPELLDGPDIGPAQVLVARSHNGRTIITPVDGASRDIVEKELYSLGELQRMDQLEAEAPAALGRK